MSIKTPEYQRQLDEQFRNQWMSNPENQQLMDQYNQDMMAYRDKARQQFGPGGKGGYMGGKGGYDRFGGGISPLLGRADPYLFRSTL